MTKEELEKEATEYALEWGDKTDGTYACCRDGYLAGALPREERIAELEEKLEQTEKDLEDYQFNYPKIKELEQKNAELKEYNKYLRRKRQGGIQKQYNKVAIIKQQDEHLTNAKDIIREFVEWANWQGSNCPSFKSIQDKAEQFLSEVEK